MPYRNIFNTFFKSSILWMLFGALGTLPVAAAAQAKPKILIINSDSSVEKYRQAEDEFRQQIKAHADRIVDVKLDRAERPEALEKLIADENPDLIYSIGSKAYQLANQSKSNKPVLFSSVINWQRFERGKNNYGVANELSLSQELSLLRYLLPNARRIGILYDPRYSRERVAEARNYAREVGLSLVEQAVEDADNVTEALDALLPKADVLWLIADPGVLADRETIEQIFASGEEQKKPIYTYSDAFVRYGASLVVAADTPTIGRQAANLAQSILRHEPIAEAVQAPAGSHITLNVCQLGKLKASYNEDALDSVNQLLECR
jgi:putative ABC transport system substrate-binding protein